MRNSIDRAIATFLFLILSGVIASAQQSRGTINGRISDSDGRALPGAEVKLDPAGVTAVSDGQGQFIISNLPAGEYAITISSVGFKSFTKKISVAAGAISVDARLEVGDVSASVTVRPERQQGEVEALNRERTADNIVQVLSAKVITSLPNTNIADAVGRLPSVSLERDEGEGKYVQIRGTEPRLSNLTVNGTHISSPEPGNRFVKLDVIPSDLVDSIEVSKTLSANQDGDAIGGSINLVTRTADDVPFYSFTGLGGFTKILGVRGVTQGAATGGRRFGAQKKLGVIFGGSYDYNGRGIYDIEPAPGLDDSGRGTITDIDLRDYKYYRHRYGFAGGTDYRLRNGSSAYFRGLFSEFRNWGERPVYSVGLGDGSKGQGGVDYNDNLRRPLEQIFSVTGGENLNFGNYTLKYQGSFSRSRQLVRSRTAKFSGPGDLTITPDVRDPLVPKFTVVGNTNIYDPNLYKLSSIQTSADKANENDFEGSADLIRRYSIGRGFGRFEVGVKIRNANKVNNADEPTFNTTSGTSILLSQFSDKQTDPNYYYGKYKFGVFTDYNKLNAFLDANKSTAFAVDDGVTRIRSDPNSYDTTERIFAEYVQNTIHFSKVRLQTGVRFETTQSKFQGNHVVTNSSGAYVSTAPVFGNRTYTDVLPSVQFLYAITPSTNIRAAFGIGIARPNFSDLPPKISENDQRNSISIGNPNLRPTKANNFDILLEHYLKPFGLIQVGGFYKDLKDPIYSIQTIVPAGQPFAGFKQTQPTNGSKAHIAGIEASFQEQLSFLPGALSGIGIFANYSYTKSKAIVPNRTDTPSLIRQGPNNWNVDASYDWGGLSARFGVTHNDAYIYQYNFTNGADGGIKGPNGDVYLYAHTQLDLQGSYKITQHFQIIASGLNLSNEVFGFYQGSPQFTIQREYYSPTFTFGFRWTSGGK